METVKISAHVTETSMAWAYGAIFSTSVFLLLLIGLHFLKRDLNPTWHMVSEYAIGRHGWMMQTSFVCLAFSCVCSALACWPLATTIGGRIGTVLLILAAIGLTIAAFNNTDAINTPKEEMSAHGKMHGFGFMIGVPSLTIAVILVSLSLVASQGWNWARVPLLWSAQVPWISVVAMVAIMIILLPRNEGKFGPGISIGLPNRLWVLGCCAWILIVAAGIIKIGKEQTGTKASDRLQNEKLTAGKS